MIIPDGWFKGKSAELRTNAEGDWVRIEDEAEFCVKGGKIVSAIECNQRDLRHVYDLLLAEKRRRTA